MTTATSDRRARNRRRRERDLQKRRPATRPSRWTSLPVVSALAVLGGAAIIAVAVFVAGRPGPASPPGSLPPSVAGLFEGLPTDGFTLGRADAPVTIDLYEDFQCPACRRWGESVFPTLAANELKDGRARIVFHDFAFIGSESHAAARAGHAAASQGRFWEMWAAIYAGQGAENSGALTEPRLTEIARGLGLDLEQFTADLSLPATAHAVNGSIDRARELGVNSTPTVAVNGRLLVGAAYDEIAAAVADAIAD